MTGTISQELQQAVTPQSVNLGLIQVPRSVVFSWGIVALLGVLFFLAGRRAKMRPGKLQLVGEVFVKTMDDFITGTLGARCAGLSPYFGALALYLAVANLSGLLDLVPPTKDLNVTAGLALCSFFVIYGTLLAVKGPKGALKRLIEPNPAMLPFNIIDMATRPLSLCMRLFGNIFGAFVVMTLVHHLTPAVVPSILGLYFDLFDGLIQMAVFVFITLLFTQDVLD